MGFISSLLAGSREKEAKQWVGKLYETMTAKIAEIESQTPGGYPSDAAKTALMARKGWIQLDVAQFQYTWKGNKQIIAINHGEPALDTIKRVAGAEIEAAIKGFSEERKYKIRMASEAEIERLADIKNV